MITAPIACVVDASVGIKVVLAEPDSAQALLLFDHLDRDPNAVFYISDLFFFECANILRTGVKRGLVVAADAPTNLAILQGKKLLRWSSASVVNDALMVALAHDLSVYDATYVVASAQLGVPLITADARLVRKLAGTAYDVQLLSTLTIPPPPAPPPASGTVAP